jgi:hypothetical protein
VFLCMAMGTLVSEWCVPLRQCTTGSGRVPVAMTAAENASPCPRWGLPPLLQTCLEFGAQLSHNGGSQGRDPVKHRGCTLRSWGVARYLPGEFCTGRLSQLLRQSCACLHGFQEHLLGDLAHHIVSLRAIMSWYSQWPAFQVQGQP